MNCTARHQCAVLAVAIYIHAFHSIVACILEFRRTGIIDLNDIAVCRSYDDTEGLNGPFSITMFRSRVKFPLWVRRCRSVDVL